MTKCSECRFWRERQEHGSGECHRHAPRPVVALSPADPGVWWPVTADDDGCEDGKPSFRGRADGGIVDAVRS